MFTTPVYIAILSSPSHADVLAVFETPELAIAQCHAWTAGRTLTETQRGGVVFHAGYGKVTVTVHRCLLELADPADEDALTLDLDPEPPHPVTRMELLRCQQEARRMEQEDLDA